MDKDKSRVDLNLVELFFVYAGIIGVIFIFLGFIAKIPSFMGQAGFGLAFALSIIIARRMKQDG